jgi:hypothetical protein
MVSAQLPVTSTKHLMAISPKLLLCNASLVHQNAHVNYSGRASQAIAQGRDLLASELGDLYVCTTCGETREGTLIGACPVCDTVPEAHKQFLVIEAMGTL